MGDAIVVEKLGKRYRKGKLERVWTLQESVISAFRRTSVSECFWSLRNVSFSVPRGKTVGVLGHNGAGKSTLLRLIGGIGKPDEGKIDVNGRLGGLLHLGAGFHFDLTGRENVMIGGVIRGFTRREVAERFDSIVAFSELEHAIDRPIRTYSTGMQMRLAFALAIHSAPEILLVDEVLAVGDLAFQQKCLNAIRDLREQGGSILVVTHDVSVVKQLCDEAVWLQEGCVAAQGDAPQIARRYAARMQQETVRQTPVRHVSSGDGRRFGEATLVVGENRFGSLEASIDLVRIYGESGSSASEIISGEKIAIELEYSVVRDIPAPIFSVTILRQDGRTCYDTSTENAGLEMLALTRPGQIAVEICGLFLDPGSYYVDVGVYKPHWVYTYDYHAWVHEICVRNPDNLPLRSPPLSFQPQSRWKWSERELLGVGI